MKTTLVLVGIIGLALLGACNPTSGPPTPSSAEAAPSPPTPSPVPVGAWCSGASQVCIDACTAMQRAGCGEPPSCPCTLANVEAHRLNPNPSNSNLPLRCSDLVTVTSVADVKARGWSCGP